MRSMAIVTVSKTKVKKEGGVVILSLKEYERLREQAIPTYYLKGKEAKALDKLVAEGLKGYKAGNTVSARSLTEALRIYERRKTAKHK